MRFSFKIDDGKDRHYGLDLFRVLAILSVILFHFPRHSEDLIFRAISHYGYLGVDIFFVLSGFLIGGQTFSRLASGKKFGLKQFCIRRFYRTLPNYYFILLIHVFIYGIDKFNWKFLFFLQNIGGLYSFTHSWSLCIEEHFYILFPLCLLVIAKFKKIHTYPLIIVSLVIGTIFIRYSLWSHFRPDITYYKNVDDGFEIFYKYLFYPTFSRLDGIAVGTLIAYFKFFRPNLWYAWLKKSNMFLALSIVIFVLISAFSWTQVSFFASTFGFSGYALSFGLLLISLIPEDSLLVKVKIPFIKEISILSYALYLTHSFAIHLARKIALGLGFDSNLWPTWLLIPPLAGLLAYLLYVILEKPVLKVRDRSLNKS